MHSHSILMNMLVFMAAAVVAVPLATRLGLGNVLGYLIAGAVIGPWGLKLISNVSDILAFAEFGIVLLLFIIGLELRPGRLWNMRRDIFGFGTLQIVLSMVALGVPLAMLGLSTSQIGILAFGFSLSSTAFALQILTEKHEINTQYGRASFAVLLFQDIAVVPVMIMLPILTQSSGQGNSGFMSLLPGLAALAAVLTGARFAVRPFFRVVVRAKSRELFTAASLLLVFSIAALMEAAGFSMALGTFVAGVVLSESEYRHELEANIEPFKGLLLGLFFIAVGMSMDFGVLLRYPLLVPLAVLALLALKIFAIWSAGNLFRYDAEVSRNIAFLICQGGEFAFVLFKLSSDKQLLPPETVSIANVVVALSLLATPLVYLLNARYLRVRFAASEWKYDDMPSEHNPVLIAGFGRYGQIIGRMLRLNDIRFTALEIDYEQVQAVGRFGNKVYYGDASRIDLLEAAGAAHAKIFVIAVDDMEASVRIAEIVTHNFPHLKVLARARNRAHAHSLMDLGVTDIRRETFASGLETAHAMLRCLGFTEKKASKMISVFREHDEAMLVEQRQLRDNEKLFIDYTNRAGLQLAEVFRRDLVGEEKEKD
ncbi:MAG TPA: monovalent cation:proton antiporter-2 (CPA2) family protein [Turneriella sp.]|nr:monovalent cation:proton antiporter-2 (CPA2) family protein [Turneriella sp.]HNE18308.1 monovalent cation:proton antiporter-2 (CPA2) family protein [Turneriella sp.]HNL09376.1 monovalent cation:proton antiporter-2 (CPA2) family protein [Turneriella sp.]HNM99482.1 monovalent cation:proton antiporter-2 (CPA2) family protein [Turneriella sp.]